MTKLRVILLVLVTSCSQVGRATMRPGSDMALPARPSVAAALLGCDDGLAPAQVAEHKQRCLTTRPDTVPRRPMPPTSRQ